MNHYRTTLLVALSILVVSVGVAEATGKRKCAEDYRRFCSQWGLETRGLQNCMRRHGDYLSKRCIKGLVQAGAVSQAEVNKRRAQIGR
jgi:hypothetical protein